MNNKKSPNSLKCLVGYVYFSILVCIIRTILKQKSQLYPYATYNLHCREDLDDANRISLG